METSTQVVLDFHSEAAWNVSKRVSLFYITQMKVQSCPIRQEDRIRRCDCVASVTTKSN